MKKLLSLLAIVLLVVSACKEPEPIDPVDPDPVLQIPSTYSFERDGESTVSYSGQTQRLDMMDEMTTYLKSGDKLNAVIDAARLQAMYANEAGAEFTGTYEKNIKSKTFADDVDFFMGWMTAMDEASDLQQEAAEGKAGFLSETYGTGTPATVDNAGYLVNENGIEFKQVIQKGLMGACFYYQAMEVYLTADRMGEIGNDENAEGKSYTNMEHYFDEAFGYFGVEPDFPGNTEVRYWGKYCQTRNDGGGSGRFTYSDLSKTIMDAFLKGRAAIAAKDYDARDAALEVVAHSWEKVIGSTAADYLNRAKSDQNPPTWKRHHYLSEAIGFLLSLKYNFDGGSSKINRQSSAAGIEKALDIIGPETDLWALTDADLDNAINEIINAFPDGVIE
ncbi:MAG: DUF4856 domain-containing protein [Bacteroidota bacterium]